MKTLKLTFALALILIGVLIIMNGCTANIRSRAFGGSQKIELLPGET
jgi:flagellar biogenesis protein FliO